VRQINTADRQTEKEGNTSWWTEALQQQKCEVLRKKRRIRNADPSRKDFVLREYLEAKEKYNKMSNETQTRSWREFCTTQDRESMWDGIYRVLRNTAERQEDSLLRNGAGETLNPKQ
jgi:hypothetical protein